MCNKEHPYLYEFIFGGKMKSFHDLLYFIRANGSSPIPIKIGKQ